MIQLLTAATRMLITLSNNPNWKNELLYNAPPVLWFGNSKSEKPKVLTMGANPSRAEFLQDNKNIAKQKISNGQQPTYLSNKRFYHLNNGQSFTSIINNNNLQTSILDSYDRYFKVNPYRKWFGINKMNSYNVEGVLRGLDASYYDIDSKYRACHIDIIPFTTISDFNQIQNMIASTLLNNGWGKPIVDDLIDYFNPEVILIFGLANFNNFCKYFKVSPGSKKTWKSCNGKGKCDYWTPCYGQYKIIGLSTNLGNPIGFDSRGLNDLGCYLNTVLLNSKCP